MNTSNTISNSLQESMTMDPRIQIMEGWTNTYGMDCHVLLHKPEGAEHWETMHHGEDFIYGEEGYCWYFRTGKRAAEIMAAIKASVSGSIRIARFKLPQERADEIRKADTWKEREAAKFTDGTYTPLPWAGEAWFKDLHEQLNHFAHVSQEDPSKIAYTKSDQHGREDRQTRVSPGRYLREYFGQLLEEEPRRETGDLNVKGEKTTIDALQYWVRQFQVLHGEATEVYFATTREEIREVYINGPDSCMGGKRTSHFSCHPIHPCEVYAAGDLALAYMKDGERITARGLVWPETKAVGRLYGDTVALQSALTDLGYRNQDWYSLNGARILRIDNPNGEGYVMPYIDGDNSYGRHEDGEHWKISGNWGSAAFQNGLDREEHDCICACCEEGMSEDEANTVNVSEHDCETWCDGCRDHNAFWCDHSDQYFSDSVGIFTTHNGRTVADYYIDEYFECTVTNEMFHSDDCAGKYEEDREPVSDFAVRKYGLVTDDDGIYWHPDNLPANSNSEESEEKEAAA